MSKNSVVELTGRDAFADPLTELLRGGAQKLIRHAVEAELHELLSAHSDRKTESGHAAVVGNGHLPECELQAGVGPVTVIAPKIWTNTG